MTTAIRGAQPFTEPERRVDGERKVTGAAAYLADRIPSGSLWMAASRSPYPHALVRSVSTDAARAMPGVRAILTGRDVEGVRFGRRLQDWPILASDRVRFIGDRIAAVAADTADQAAAAAAAIEVEFMELPAVLDPAQALAPDAPILHPDADSYMYIGGTRAPAAHPNVQGRTIAVKGDPDIDRILAGADRVFEQVFTTRRQHQGYIEPHGASVWIELDGRIHVLTTNKSPFSLRNQLALAFGIDVGQLEVENGYIGGDFGGKGLSLDEPICLALARSTGRPVSAVMTYADELQAANPRHGSTIRLRTGVDGTGRIIAHAAEYLFDGGAYAAGKPMPDLTPPGPLATLAAYDVEHVRIEVTVVYTNTVPAGHMRGPGEVQASFAGESHVDEIARELGSDPLAFRRANVARPGTRDVVGREIRDPQGADLLDLIEADHGTRPVPAHGGWWRRGRGISMTARHMEGGHTTVRLCADRDGTIEIRTGVPDQGGGAHTMMARVAATVLDLPIDRFRVRLETTAHGTPDLGVGASRVTYIGSRATESAAETLRRTILDRASNLTDGASSRLEDGLVLRVDGTAVTSWDEVVAGLDEPLEVAGSFDSAEFHSEPQDFSLAAYSIDVEVDERTGVVRLIDAFFAGDVGTVINPIAHQGQIEGGFAFGIGAALLEELEFDEGRITNVHLGDYKLPTIQDVPRLRTRYLHANGRGAFGAKMAGELSVSGVAPAIANAVADAIGVRLTTLPLSPERVLEALEAASSRRPRSVDDC
jgi:CO/xanthine dehydrogenase Mo-binding subunit